MRKRLTNLFIIMTAVLAVLSAGSLVFPSADAASGGDQVSIVYTGGTHAACQPISVTEDGKSSSAGGYARIKTTIDDVTSSYPDSLVVDAGSSIVGTAYQTLNETEAPVLVLMGQMGYDAVALGGGEFIEGSAELGSTVEAARVSGGKVSPGSWYFNTKTESYVNAGESDSAMPDLIVPNIDWNKTRDDDSLKEGIETLGSALFNYGATDYTIIEKGGTRIAVFSIVGYEAIDEVSESGVIWRDPEERAQEVTDEITANGEADLIVCLYSGSFYSSENPLEEERSLADAVPAIDVLITNTPGTGDEAVTEGDTIIVGTGSEVRSGSLNVGHLVLKKDGDSYVVDQFDIIPQDSSVEQDTELQSQIDSYQNSISEQYFSKFGYTYGESLTSNTVDFSGWEEASVGETSLGNLMADSYLYADSLAGGGADSSVPTVSVVPAGILSGYPGIGTLTAADAFSVASYGEGPDGLDGFPLVDFYITGRELKSMVDISVSLGADDPEDRLSFGNLKYSYNEHRIKYNRAFDFSVTVGGQEEAIDSEKTYRIVTDLYTFNLLKQVKSDTGAALSVTPKDEDGSLITDGTTRILTYNGGELKSWQALAMNLEQYGSAGIPETYFDTGSRAVDKTGFSPASLFQEPNRFTIIRWVAVLIPIALIIIIALILRARRNRRRGYVHALFERAGSPVMKGKPKPAFKRPRRRRNYWK